MHTTQPFMAPIREGDEFWDRLTGQLVTVMPPDSHPYDTVVIEPSHGQRILTAFTSHMFLQQDRFVRYLPCQSGGCE